MAGLGGVAGGFPAGPYVRHTRADEEDGSRFSTGTRVAAAVVAVGGLAGAAYTAAGSPELPLTEWTGSTRDAATGTAAADAVLPSPRTSPEQARPAVADPGAIAALATPAAGGSTAVRAVSTAGTGIAATAAEAAGGASASVGKVQRAAAERARAAAAAEKARATAGTSDATPRSASGGTTRTASTAASGAVSTAASGAASAGAAGPSGAVSIVSGRLTSGFGARWGSQHKGLDIAAPIGTPIRVPLAGTVISSGPASGFGLWVRVQHADGTITVYGHINRSLVKVGQKVTAGQQIAEVGNRGQSTGPHLHIEVVQNGTKINPKPWLDRNGFRYG